MKFFTSHPFVWLFCTHRAYSHSIPGEYLGVTPQDIYFIFSTADDCSILMKLLKFPSEIFTLCIRKDIMEDLYWRYIQISGWGILGTIKFHLVLNILLLGLWKDVQNMILSLRHWDFSLLLLVHDLLLTVIFMDLGTLVIDQIYMLKPTGASKRAAIATVHSIGANRTTNPKTII